MSGKLVGLRSISTNTLTNPFCVAMNTSGKGNNICTHCYSHTMLKGYRKNTAPPLERNSKLLSTDILKPHQIPKIKDEIFRFNAHGEVINFTHPYNLMKIVEANPKTHFALWSKKKKEVGDYFTKYTKPHNITVIYSNPIIGSIVWPPPKGFDKTFNNVYEDELKDQQNCTGQKCDGCRLCYSHNDTGMIIEKLKRY